MFPRIHLAIDNCFASKRWTTPGEWMQEIRDAGIYAVEASADTELDPLYMGEAYVERWCADVLQAQERTGVRVANLYSGHGSYATLGLAHTDREVRERFLNRWLKPMVDTAAALQAGFGFFCHAFPQAVLADARQYEEEFQELTRNLAEVARYAGEKGMSGDVGVEQMYTPHQAPWTITQARRLLRDVFARGGAPFYITIDVGHQSGQSRYRRPSRDDLLGALDYIRSTGNSPEFWVGPEPVLRHLRHAAGAAGAAGATARARENVRAVQEIEALLDRYPHLFAREADGDPYAWLRELAGWSPIVHLQQTDGNTSAHRPFNEETNRTGIIEGGRVLRAIHEHYSNARDDGTLPPRVADIYLTLEIFSGTAETPERIRRNVRESAEYWRRFIPADGMGLDELVRLL